LKITFAEKGENGMEEKEAKQLGLELMETADIVYFTTIDQNGWPQTRPLANLRNKGQFPKLTEFFDQCKDDYSIFLATCTNSSKISQLKANSKVSVCYCNPGEVHSMMVAGIAEIVTDEKIKNKLWQDGWEVYYPGGPEGPYYTVLRLRPNFAKGWYKDKGPLEFNLGE
jgi:general stress protein 26